MNDPSFDVYVDSSYYGSGDTLAQVYWGLMSIAGGCTQGILFNFADSKYDLMAESCGTQQTGFNSGWSMWESYFMDHLTDPSQCPLLPDEQSMVYMIKDSTARPETFDYLYQGNITDLGPYGLCWDAGQYSITWNNPQWWGWQALTP